ncbi:MAG: uracil-DNA glycosylase [Verrucomicrobia bacterium]|nr:uracil-DNA glycosylase [Verrucomicrobiota bacterium]
MSSFIQGLDILLRQLRGLDTANRPRVDQAIIVRIERLRRDGAEEMSSQISAPAEISSRSSVNPVGTSSASSVSVVREDTPGVGEPDEQELGPTEDREQRIAALREKVLVCRKCPHLAEFRHTVVFGVGNPSADLMFVGEAPGADEDLRGEPFVGRAGELLTRIIETMGFKRSDVYIANVLKCRPDMPKGSSGNRQPTPEEMQTCLPYLRDQIEIIQPKVMVALGGVAMRGLFGTAEPMKSLRGRWHTFGNIPVMATFHPSYLLRNQALTEKRKVWEDMLQVLERLGVPITQRQRNFFLSKPGASTNP